MSVIVTIDTRAMEAGCWEVRAWACGSCTKYHAARFRATECCAKGPREVTGHQCKFCYRIYAFKRDAEACNCQEPCQHCGTRRINWPQGVA